MTSNMKRLVLALALVTLPVSAGAQIDDTATDATTTDLPGTDVDVQNDAITTETENNGEPGDEVQGVEGTGVTDADVVDPVDTDVVDPVGTDVVDPVDTDVVDPVGTDVVDPVDTDIDVVDAEEDTRFPWGLLGLLGLAGLMGRSRPAPQPVREVKLGGPTDGPRR